MPSALSWIRSRMPRKRQCWMPDLYFREGSPLPQKRLHFRVRPWCSFCNTHRRNAATPVGLILYPEQPHCAVCKLLGSCAETERGPRPRMCRQLVLPLQNAARKAREEGRASEAATENSALPNSRLPRWPRAGKPVERVVNDLPLIAAELGRRGKRSYSPTPNSVVATDVGKRPLRRSLCCFSSAEEPPTSWAPATRRCSSKRSARKVQTRNCTR